MLRIRTFTKGNMPTVWHWHVNTPLPEIEGPIVNFEADGHELELFLIAMNMNFTYDGKLVPFKPGE